MTGQIRRTTVTYARVSGRQAHPQQAHDDELLLAGLL